MYVEVLDIFCEFIIHFYENTEKRLRIIPLQNIQDGTKQKYMMLKMFISS